MLFVISAPSGTGKTTICGKILKKLNDIVYSVSYTTRPRKKGEIDGRDYHFITEEKFKDMIRKNKFIEYTKVYGHLYGTEKEFIYKNINKSDILLDLDSNGAKEIKKKFHNDAILIYLLPPSLAELKKRLKKRAREEKEEMKKRLNAVKNELKEVNFYDYIFVNKNSNETAYNIISTILAERHRTNRVLKSLKKIIK